MSYNDRLTIVTYEETEDELGSPIREKVEVVVPCYRGRLTHEQQIGMFGSYDLNAMKFHLQGHYDEIEEVKYKEYPRRKVRGLIIHPNSTVVIV